MSGATELLTVRQAATILQVREDTVRRWTRRGLIRHVVLSGKWLRYHPDDIDAFLEARTVEASS